MAQEQPTSRKKTLWRRALQLIGIESNPQSRWHLQLKPRFFVLVLVGIGVLFLSLAGLAAYSTSPSFCRSCHIMEPYYQAWSNSKHKDVACVECHYPPGETSTILWKKFQAVSQVVKFITRTYSSKPYAEVEDASCLRSGCHSTRLLQGRVVSEKGVLFDHRPHLEGVRRGKQLRCVSCHSQIVVGKHIEVTWDTCFLCHFENHKDGKGMTVLGGCQGCHLLPSKSVQVGNITYNHKDFLGQHPIACQSCHQDVVQGEGAVPEERCLTCHNQPEKVARYKETAFIHENHVTKHNTACFHCHSEIHHRATPAGTKSLTYDCAVCHSDKHDLQRNIYRGMGAKGVPLMPSPMYLANVDCIGCHVEKKVPHSKVSRAETLSGSEKGCIRCHGKEYAGILTDVHTLTNETVLKLKEKLSSITQTLSAGAQYQSTPKELADLIEEISYNLDFIRSARSVHNIYYAAQVLRYTDTLLTTLAKKAKVQTEDTSRLPVISGGFCATLCHSRVVVEVPPEKVHFQGKEMPHKKHVEEGLNCVACHNFGMHKEVTLKAPTNCKRCHEEDEKRK